MILRRTLYLAGAVLLAGFTPMSLLAAELDTDALLQTIEQLKKRVSALEAERDTKEGSPISKQKIAKSEKPATEQAVSEGENKAKDKKDPDSAENVLETTMADLQHGGITLQEISDGFDVPNSPAAAVLGISPDKVQHLETPKQLVPTVINGLDENGNFQSGLAVDFAPAQWAWGRRPISEFRYEADGSLSDNLGIWLKRALVRTQLSFATTKGTSDEDKSSKFALGIHSVLVNGDDALSNAEARRIRTAAGDDFIVSAEDNRSLDARGRKLNHWVFGMKELEENDAQALPFESRGFLADIGNFFYTHTSWAIGAAPQWVKPDEEGDYEYAGTTVWSSFAYVPSRKMAARFLFDVIYREGEIVPFSSALEVPDAPAAAPGGAPAPSPTSIEQDSLFLIAGMRVGNRDFNATLTAAYLHLDQNEFGTDSAFRYTLSAEKRISSNSWLTVSVSQDQGRDNGDSETLVLGGVKIGLGGRDFDAAGQKTRAEQHARD